MNAKSMIEAAFAAAQEHAGDVSAEWEQRLDDYRAHSVAVLDDLAAGRVTQAEAMVAAEQAASTAKSALLSGAYDAAKASQAAALSVVVAVLKAALVAAV